MGYFKNVCSLIVKEGDNEMTNAQKFLELFNHLDDLLREYYNDFDRSRSLIARYAGQLEKSNNKIMQERGRLLNEIRVFRNSLIHEFDMNRDGLFEVSEKAIETLRREIEYLDKPSRASDIMTKTQNIISLNRHSLIGEAIRVMVEKGFLHLPILEDGHLIGVFSPNALFLYLAEEKHTEGRVIDLKMDDLMDYVPINKHISEFYEFASRKDITSDINDMFASYSKIGKRLALVFVTENGEEDEYILGLISASDLLKNGNS